MRGLFIYFLVLGKQMGKHAVLSWYECPTVTIMTLARTAESDADSCCLAYIIFNLLSQLMQDV